MTKAILNVFILILICFGLSAIPINSKILDLSIQTDSKKAADASSVSKNAKIDKEPIFAIVPVLPSNSTLTVPESIDFEISSSNIKDSADNIKKYIQVDILKDGKTIKSSTSDKLGSTMVLNTTDVTRARLKIPFDYKSLGIISGNYNAKITILSSDEQNGSSSKKAFSYTIIYFDDKSYAASSDARTTRANIYYADMDDNIIIPISEYVSSQRRAAVSLGDILYSKLPESSGFKSPASELYKAEYTLKSGVLTVNFDSKAIFEKNLAISDNTLLLQTIIDSALSNDSVQTVKLTVDGGDDITILNSKLSSNSFVKNAPSPKVYAGYINKSSYVYIVPMQTSATTPDGVMKELSAKALPKLKKGSYFNTVPSSVKLIDSKLENGMLTLNMNGNFKTAFGADSDYIGLMIDSIVNSMSFIPGVEKISFLSDGKPIEQIGELKIQTVYTPKFQLNPISFSK